MLESKAVAEVIECSVDLAKGGLDLAGVSGLAWWRGLCGEGREWSEQTLSEFDEQDAESESEAGQAVAPTCSKAFHQAFRS